MNAVSGPRSRSISNYCAMLAFQIIYPSDIDSHYNLSFIVHTRNRNYPGKFLSFAFYKLQIIAKWVLSLCSRTTEFKQQYNSRFLEELAFVNMKDMMDWWWFLTCSTSWSSTRTSRCLLCPTLPPSPFDLQPLSGQIGTDKMASCIKSILLSRLTKQF